MLVSMQTIGNRQQAIGYVNTIISMNNHDDNNTKINETHGSGHMKNITSQIILMHTHNLIHTL